MENISIITNSVWVEMHRVKGFLMQIEMYTDRKRNCNMILNAVIICLSIICAVASFFHNVPYIPWVSILSALLVAVITCLKEFMPHLLQPERELCELDNIHNYYSSILHELEYLYVQRFDKQSNVDDHTMNERLNQLKKTEGDRVTRINMLCRKFKEAEKDKIIKETKTYFNTKYNSNNYERES